MITPRLFYLASELRQPIPKSLLAYVPQGEILQHLATYGLNGVSTGLGIAEDQLRQLIDTGSMDGPASQKEWRYLTSKIIDQELDEAKEELPLEAYLALMRMLDLYYSGQTSLIEKTDGDFLPDGPVADIPKFSTGFEPLDALFQGFYQGVFIIMGQPGTGKTSHMISIAEMIRKTQVANSIWMFQMEIPKPLFEYRIHPASARVKFRPEIDHIYYGFTPVVEMISMAQTDPDPERIIFFDGPDILAESGETKRMNLEQIFRELVILKQLCKAVFVTSQPRRNDKILQQTSVADAWAKAWFADGIIGIKEMGTTPRGISHFKASSLKNRFGPSHLSINYDYNLVDLTYSFTGGTPSSSGWESGSGDDTW